MVYGFFCVQDWNRKLCIIPIPPVLGVLGMLRFYIFPPLAVLGQQQHLVQISGRLHFHITQFREHTFCIFRTAIFSRQILADIYRLRVHQNRGKRMVCVYQRFQICLCCLKVPRIILGVNNGHEPTVDFFDPIPSLPAALTGSGFRVYATTLGNSNACFPQFLQQRGRHHVIRHGNPRVAQKIFIHPGNFCVRQYPHRLDPAGKEHFTLCAACPADLPSHGAGVPRMPAYAVFRPLGMISGGHFADRHLTFHGHKVIPCVRAAELVIDNKVRRMHIRIVCRRKASLSLAFIQLELAVFHKVGALNGHLPLSEFACILVLAVHTGSHGRIELPVHNLHGLIRLNGLLTVEEVERVLVRDAEGVHSIIILQGISLLNGIAHSYPLGLFSCRRIGFLPPCHALLQRGHVRAVGFPRRLVPRLFAAEQRLDLCNKGFQCVQQLPGLAAVLSGEVLKQPAVLYHLHGEVGGDLVHGLLLRQRHTGFLRH